MSRAAEFTGARDASAPLTWTQHQTWKNLQLFEPQHTNVGWYQPLPVGLTMGDLCQAVGHVMGAFEALRTRYALDAAGSPRQTVDMRGRVAMDTCASSDALAESDARKVLSGFIGRGFEHERDLPVRFAAVLVDEAPVYLVVAASHLSLDGFACGLVKEALDESVSRARPEGPAAPRLQPVDRARLESSPDGALQNNTSLAYWKRTLETCPAANFPKADQGGTGTRWSRSVMRSPALEQAAGLLAATHKVSPSAVLQAGVSALVGALSGNENCVFSEVVSNRASIADKTYVGDLAQGAVVLVRTTGTTFAELVRDTWLARITAYANSRYHPLELDDLWADVERVRGEKILLDCLYNDMATTQQARPSLAESELRAMVGETTVRSEPISVDTDAKLSLHLYGTPGGVDFAMRVDPDYVAGPGPERFLRALESLLVEEVESPGRHRPIQRVAELAEGSAAA
ncbi:condensation domain-containing protein [Streptomyces pathocidini]|uniref:Condensation domain-containing protein n=1 Tax=Streptomyces pathocidini TaxID=1650571 RepID=A0ABW7UMX0_9ACTN|nr:condensation domain-containing protein [Streptomyces pathocidini]